VVCHGKTNRPSGKGLLKTILYVSMLDPGRLSSTAAHGVQVFLHRLFHVVEIMGNEGHGVNNFRSKYLLYSWTFLFVLYHSSVLRGESATWAGTWIFLFITNCILVIQL